MNYLVQILAALFVSSDVAKIMSSQFFHVSASPVEGEQTVAFDNADVTGSQELPDDIAPETDPMGFYELRLDEPVQSLPVETYATVEKIAELDNELADKIAKLLPDPNEHAETQAFEPRSHKKLLVFDLDETLIYVDRQVKKKIDAPYRLRPGINTMLAELAKYYDLGIWTAGFYKYGSKALAEIDPTASYFPIHRRIFRNSIKFKTNFVKPLKMLGYDMRNVVLVDNKMANFREDSIEFDGKPVATNGIGVKDVYHRHLDAEMKDELAVETDELIRFLIQIHDAEDVRPFIVRRNVEANDVVPNRYFD